MIVSSALGSFTYDVVTRERDVFSRVRSRWQASTAVGMIRVPRNSDTVNTMAWMLKVREPKETRASFCLCFWQLVHLSPLVSWTTEAEENACGVHATSRL